MDEKESINNILEKLEVIEAGIEQLTSPEEKKRIQRF